MTKAETTPVWGYSPDGQSQIFDLKGDELLPEGWYESPGIAQAEGRNEAVERELRYALERRAEAVKLTIDPAWTVQRLETEVHRAEVVEGAKAAVAPKRAEPPKDKDVALSPARKEALVATAVPPSGESGSEMGQRAHRIDEQQKKAAKLLKADEAAKRAEADKEEKPTADEVEKNLEKTGKVSK